MTRRIVVERAAEEDLFAAVDYYVRQGTPATARRFVTAAQETFARLAGTPDIGHRCTRPCILGSNISTSGVYADSTVTSFSTMRQNRHYSSSACSTGYAISSDSSQEKTNNLQDVIRLYFLCYISPRMIFCCKSGRDSIGFTLSCFIQR